MEKKYLNIFLMIEKKSIVQKLLAQKVIKETDYIQKLFDDFVIDEYDDAITDPGLLFNNEILDEDYYLEKYRGFGPCGWNCIDLLVKNSDNEIINKLFEKINR